MSDGDNGGRIINFLTTLTVMMLPAYSICAIREAAIEEVTRVLDRELGPKKITVNVVSPGTMDTALFAQGETEGRKRIRAGWRPCGVWPRRRARPAWWRWRSAGGALDHGPGLAGLSRQMARFKQAANVTHRKYGTSIAPDQPVMLINSTMVARIAAQRRTISTKPHPGCRR
jgi:NAD(P)-dependent dehydrogenase (short-subunit alcohol dehydrogenase family)